MHSPSPIAVFALQAMHDAFNCLGVNLAPEVLGEVMRACDTDQTGRVDYQRMIKRLFYTRQL